jgi:peptidyl-prolyl cis-trans isomerase B (cyclophilin B)
MVPVVPTLTRIMLTAPAALLALAVAGCSSSSSQPAAAPATTPASSSAAAITPAGSPSASSPSASSAPAGAAGTATCTYTPTGGGSVSLPPSTADPAATYSAVLHTSAGDIGISLRGAKAPCTVNSFAHLAQAGFWAGTQCHRLSTDGGLFMLQCGDPTAKASAALSCDSQTIGTGTPGYSFADENLAGATYPAGTVAMANAGPNTNGSQFFLVFQDTQLPASYTPFGTISAAGLSVLRKVAAAGTSCTFAEAGGGVPKDKVAITSVTVTKG